MRELLPIGEDQQSLGAMSRVIRVFSKSHRASGQYFLGALHRGGIVDGETATVVQQILDDADCRRLANVVSAPLEGEAKHGKVLAAQIPNRSPNLP